MDASKSYYLKQNFAHLLFGTLILSFYGTMVCPFLDSLTFFDLILEFSLVTSSLFFIKINFENRFLLKDLKRLPLNQILMDLSFYITGAIILMMYNSYHYEFPLGSGLKILLGQLTLGLFAGLDNASFRERSLYLMSQNIINVDTNKIFPISKKFSYLVILTFVFASIIIFMAIHKDLDYLKSNLLLLNKKIYLSLIGDIGFTLIILLALILRVVYSYAKNLKLLFNSQLDVLEKVHHGFLDEQIPVATYDEFGFIANRTNNMIQGLKEKEKIRNIFGKAVGTKIAKLLMNQKSEVLANGEEFKLAILFTDIRNFTTLSESIGSQELISLLNKYLPIMAKAIEDNNGLIDKFIGDAILAVYGLGHDPNQVNNAISTALKMIESLKSFNEQSPIKLEIGIGIHYGMCTAGIIGTQERYEYTVLGDTVNMASRIEGMTKTLKNPLILSKESYLELSTQLQEHFIPLGEHSLRGKTQLVSLYGLKEN